MRWHKAAVGICLTMYVFPGLFVPHLCTVYLYELFVFSTERQKYVWNGKDNLNIHYQKDCWDSEHAVLRYSSPGRAEGKRVESHTKFTVILILIPFLWSSYIQNSSSSRGDNSMRRWRWWWGRWWECPLKDSWLISFWLRGPYGEAEATGWLLRLEHMSYKFPENCIFLDSWRRDSQTAAASSGQPAMATLAQSWNSSHDLKKKKRNNETEEEMWGRLGRLYEAKKLFA